jgi:hypothetical protein
LRRLVGTVVVAALATSALAACSRDVGPDYALAGCEPAARQGRTVARIWDEALLDAIRRDVPAPTVHARNLFHLSAAMWDAWAAYDPQADGVLVTEKVEGTASGDVAAARETAISFAAYRVLLWRYSRAAGLQATFDELEATMRGLCYDPAYLESEGDGPAALGNRIAAAVIEAGASDGAAEDLRYANPDYRAVNAPLVVAEDAITMVDPDRWQPLALARTVAQNGVPIPGAVQRFIGSQWGGVQSFAMPPAVDGLPVDPGPPPRLADGDGAFEQAAVDILRRSQELDPADGVVIDVSPGVLGDNPLGTDDGDGHERNPATGEPYEAVPVLRGDYVRALAQFWADGPASETPPGHWNTIANEVVDSPGFERRLGGTGPELDPLEFDVKLYLALNSAVHDAAVAAWGVKAHYDSARPISMIRYLGSRGELPLEPGLVEVITAESAAPGERHAHLADHIGETAVRAWAGNPADPAHDTSGAAWILAIDWVPFQLATFVTPAFAGYVSGHSTFSRAAAEVLTAATGSEYFPGGLGEWVVPAGSLLPESGPSTDVRIQAATYYDAADQAGVSRLYGGIHIRADDLAGRRLGSDCGIAAWELALEHFAGTAVPG